MPTHLLTAIFVASLSASCVLAAPDNSVYEGVNTQIRDIRKRCTNTLVCIAEAVELSQSEAEIQKILEDTIRQKAGFRSGRINGICFGVVIESKMKGLFTKENSRDKMMVAAYIAYNLYEKLPLARPAPGVDCSNRVLIFYSRDDSTLYTFATEGLMKSADIRTASAAARPYFSNSVLEGMRFLIPAYVDTIKGTS